MDFLLPLISVSFSLFILMDPIGNIPVFLSVLKECPSNKKQKIILRELLIALATIILFAIAGNTLLDLLHISKPTIMISGGIVLFLIALKMVFLENGYSKPPSTEESDYDPFIVPLAIPLIAGPSVLAAVMIFSHQNQSYAITLPAICIAWIATAAILLSSSFLERKLGPRGLAACEKLMGLLLVLIAVQMILEGVAIFFHLEGAAIS